MGSFGILSLEARPGNLKAGRVLIFLCGRSRMRHRGLFYGLVRGATHGSLVLQGSPSRLSARGKPPLCTGRPLSVASNGPDPRTIGNRASPLARALARRQDALQGPLSHGASCTGAEGPPSGRRLAARNGTGGSRWDTPLARLLAGALAELLDQPLARPPTKPLSRSFSLVKASRQVSREGPSEWSSRSPSNVTRKGPFPGPLACEAPSRVSERFESKSQARGSLGNPGPCEALPPRKDPKEVPR